VWQGLQGVDVDGSILRRVVRVETRTLDRDLARQAGYDGGWGIQILDTLELHALLLKTVDVVLLVPDAHALEDSEHVEAALDLRRGCLFELKRAFLEPLALAS